MPIKRGVNPTPFRPHQLSSKPLFAVDLRETSRIALVEISESEKAQEVEPSRILDVVVSDEDHTQVAGWRAIDALLEFCK